MDGLAGPSDPGTAASDPPSSQRDTGMDWEAEAAAATASDVDVRTPIGTVTRSVLQSRHVVDAGRHSATTKLRQALSEATEVGAIDAAIREYIRERRSEGVFIGTSSPRTSNPIIATAIPTSADTTTALLRKLQGDLARLIVDMAQVKGATLRLENPNLAENGRNTAANMATRKTGNVTATGGRMSYAAAVATGAGRSPALAGIRTTHQTLPRPIPRLVREEETRQLTLAYSRMPTAAKAIDATDIMKEVRQNGPGGLVAVNVLRSGDRRLIFESTIARQSHLTDRRWLEPIHCDGPGVLREPTPQVLAKGIPTATLVDLKNNKLEEGGQGLTDLQRDNPNTPFQSATARLAKRGLSSMVVRLCNPSKANELISSGLRLGPSLYKCEPFEATLSPTQCYKCYNWGHQAKSCRMKQRCPRCGQFAHRDNSNCRAGQDGTPFFCIPCGAPGHTARNRQRCPVAQAEYARYQDLLETRPTFFAVTPTMGGVIRASRRPPNTTSTIDTESRSSPSIQSSSTSSNNATSPSDATLGDPSSSALAEDILAARTPFQARRRDFAMIVTSLMKRIC